MQSITVPTSGRYVWSTDYLSDMSERDKPWDVHRAQSDQIQALHQQVGFLNYAGRMADCSGVLLFRWDADLNTGEERIKLHKARFCRVRTCPTCQWRRSLLWMHRCLSGLPALAAAHPSARFALLTLTVPNCPISDLRSTLKGMSSAWNRLQRFPEMRRVLGWLRTTEVTVGAGGSAHPHYHALLMLPASYFKKDYVHRDRWLEMWQQATGDNFITQVDIRAIKKIWKTDAQPAGAVAAGADVPGVSSEFYRALPEVLKYATKPADFLKATPEWFKTYVEQVHKLRFLATGGALKNFLSEQTTEDELIHPEGEQPPEGDGFKTCLVFGWEKPEKRYKRRGDLVLYPVE